jgi:hypothetical protein
MMIAPLSSEEKTHIDSLGSRSSCLKISFEILNKDGVTWPHQRPVFLEGISSKTREMEPNEKVFPPHPPSIPHGAVGVGSLQPSPVVSFFFLGPFCAVAKVVMIKIWLQAKYESKKFEHPSIFLATYLNHVEDMAFVFQK